MMTPQMVANGEQPETPAQLSAIAARAYCRGPLFLRLLQRYRPFICPFEVLLPLVPRGASVLDVGCGGGLLLTLLAATGRARLGIGFDSSEHAVRVANLARVEVGAPGTALEFVRLDAQAPWPPAPALFDVVSIIDVLHHVPPAAQQSVIETAATRLGPGGRLLYKDMCRRPVWRAWANRLHDLLLARQWIHYAPVESVEAWAAACGLRLVHSARLNRWWYGHDLRVFERPAGVDQR